MNTLNSLAQPGAPLHALESVMGRLGPLSRDPDACAAAFAEFTRADPVARSALLHVATSLTHPGTAGGPPDGEAFARLGAGLGWGITLAAGLAAGMPGMFDGYDLRGTDLWRHSVAVAIYAQRLANHTRIAHAETAFAAGLLHDIGKLVIESLGVARRASDLLARLDAGEDAFLERAPSPLEADHAEAGRVVAERWKLPPPIVAAAAHHHTPEAAYAPDFAGIVGIVHIANGLAHAMGHSAESEGRRHPSVSATLTRLRVDTRVLERAASEALEEIELIGRLYARPPESK